MHLELTGAKGTNKAALLAKAILMCSSKLQLEGFFRDAKGMSPFLLWRENSEKTPSIISSQLISRP